MLLALAHSAQSCAMCRSFQAPSSDCLHSSMSSARRGPPCLLPGGQQCFCCWRSISCCLDWTKSLVWRLRAALPKLRTVRHFFQSPNMHLQSCVHDEWQISCNTSSFQNAVFFSELEIIERFQKLTNACILGAFHYAFTSAACDFKMWLQLSINV